MFLARLFVAPGVLAQTSSLFAIRDYTAGVGWTVTDEDGRAYMLGDDDFGTVWAVCPDRPTHSPRPPRSRSRHGVEVSEEPAHLSLIHI